MSSMLITDMVRDGVRRLQQATEGEEYRRSRELFRDFSAGCTMLASMIEQAWAVVDDMLDEGTEGRRLLFFLKECRDGNDALLRILGEAAETASPFEAALADARRRIEEVQKNIRALLSRLDVPPPPMDPATFAARGVPHDSANYENLDEVLSRLQAGGDV